MKMEKTLIILATAWGPQHGGINSFNYDFVKSLGEVFHRCVRVICVVPKMTSEEKEDAAGSHVELIDLSNPPSGEKLEAGHAAEIIRHLNLMETTPDNTVWLGHDLFTGGAAVEAAIQTKSASAIIHHMSYAAYEAYKSGSSGKAQDKVNEQRRIFDKAKFCFAVGPLLRDALNDLLYGEGKVSMIIPGLPTGIKPRTLPKTFTAVMFGRLDPDADRIKQGRLGIAAMGSAYRQTLENPGLPQILHDRPRLKLYGIDSNDETKLRKFAEEQAGAVFDFHPLPFDTNRTALLKELSFTSVALMPSWHEGFGLVGWEAIGAEVPLILSRTSGLYRFLSETFSGSGTGCIYEVDIKGREAEDPPFYQDEDVEAIAQKILNVAANLEKAKSSAKQLKVLLKDYTWERSAKEFAKALNWDFPNPPTGNGSGIDEKTILIKDSTGSTAFDSPTSLSSISKFNDWTLHSITTFSILGIDKPLSLDHAWIPLKTIVQSDADLEEVELSKALEGYHSWDKRQPARDVKEIDPETIGRFVHHCVIIAGPGMGKSTLLKKLARVYSEDGYPTVLIRLPVLAARILQAGNGFEESIFSLGLDGSGIDSSDLAELKAQQWTILCDGLDECGRHQDLICQELIKLAAGHSQYRIIVATRPIGYVSALLKQWRHYELLPLNPDKVESYLATILGDVFKPESEELQKIQVFAKHQIDQNKTSDIMVRTPMLLGIVTSLAIRRVNFGQTKSSLYERIFRLFGETQTTRTVSDLPKATLLRFLEILGWITIKYPTYYLEETIKKCSKILADELQISLLNSQVTCEKCLNHWESVGMLEKLRHAGNVTVTFIHKTFGEYAAARHLVAKENKNQLTMIALELDNPSFTETLVFAGSLGLVNEVVSEMLKKADEPLIRQKMVGKILEIISNSETALDTVILNSILDIAFPYLTSSSRLVAFPIAEGILAVCKRFPVEVCPRAALLIDHPQSWTKLAAWAIVTVGGLSYYKLESLIQAFKELPTMAGDKGKLFSGDFRIHLNNRRLIEAFTLSAIEQIIANCSSIEVKEIIGTSLQKDFMTVGLSMRITSLLNAHGIRELSDAMHSHWFDYSLIDRFNEPEYINAQEKAIREIFGNLQKSVCSLVPKVPYDEAVPKNLLYLSAFIDASGYGNMPISDIWDWREPYDNEAIQETLCGIVKISGIDPVCLGHETHILLQDFSKNGITNIYKRTVHVDTNPDWELVQHSNLDIQKIERALYHRSDWIVQLAANLLININDVFELNNIVKRVLKNGRSTSLWAAIEIGKKTDEIYLTELVIERLQKPLSSGCQYLFKFLSERKPKLDDILLYILRSGLMYSDPITATNAAELSESVATPGLDQLKTLLNEAYLYWKNHEEPYPVNGGVIPDSPRAKILAARLKISLPKHSDLLQYASDVRSDVKDIAEPILFEHLKSNESLRDAFLSGIKNCEIQADLLTESIRLRVPFSDEHCANICDLLNHSDAKIRSAAVELLRSGRLNQDQINFWVCKLLEDKEQDIREMALQLLNQII